MDNQKISFEQIIEHLKNGDDVYYCNDSECAWVGSDIKYDERSGYTCPKCDGSTDEMDTYILSLYAADYIKEHNKKDKE